MKTNYQNQFKQKWSPATSKKQKKTKTDRQINKQTNYCNFILVFEHSIHF